MYKNCIITVEKTFIYCHSYNCTRTWRVIMCVWWHDDLMYYETKGKSLATRCWVKILKESIKRSMWLSRSSPRPNINSSYIIATIKKSIITLFYRITSVRAWHECQGIEDRYGKRETRNLARFVCIYRGHESWDTTRGQLCGSDTLRTAVSSHSF